ncbi:hypothetical protein ABPG72_006219 [Tetrahymena utriculariae]
MSEDKMRLERKINKYMNYGASNKGADSNSISQYTSEKIKNLHKFLENVESESNMSESDFENSMQYFNKKGKSKNGGEINQFKNINDERFDDDIRFRETESKKLEEWESQLSKFNQQANDLKLTKLELDEANKTVEMLRELLSQEQKKCVEQENELRNHYENRLSTQKEELESVIERHLQFIDQLILDKKELNSQVEDLTEKYRIMEEGRLAFEKEQKEKYIKDLKLQKEAWFAAEKQRKEKWMNEKTNEIKEVTIKGLEPEIERIINRNKIEIKKLEEKHQKQINELRQNVQEEYEQKFRVYKDKVMMETEELISKERSFKTEKTKEQIQRIETNYQEDRERMKKNYESEIKDLEDKRREENDYFLKKIKEIQEDHIEEIKKLKNEMQAKMDECKYDSKHSLQQQREQIKIEQEKWMEKQIQKQNDELTKKTSEIRKKLEKERDFQIEVVISKITEENVNLEKQIASKYEQRISQLQQEHRSEIKELKRELSYYEDQNAQTSLSKNQIKENMETLTKKLLDVQNSLDKSEKENKELKKEVKELEAQLLSQKNLLKIHEENIRREMTLEIQKLHDQILVLNKTLTQMGADHSLELEKIEEKHSKSLEDVESRVKVVVMKKDQQIIRLKEEIKYKEETINKLEQMLEQRNKIFGSIMNNNNNK